MLTGQANEDFEKYLIETKPILPMDVEKWFNRQDLRYQLALIVEWFDSVRLTISISYATGYINDFKFTVYQGSSLISGARGFDSRPEATTAAIQKANEIYNKQRAIESEQK